MKKYHVHRGTSCKITAPTNKICGNESKIRMTSQNYKLFQCIFTNFLNLSQYFCEAIQNLNASFSLLTCIYQNGPDSVKFCHLSLAPMMLFGLSNKIILFVDHYQTPCISNYTDIAKIQFKSTLSSQCIV